MIQVAQARKAQPTAAVMAIGPNPALKVSLAASKPASDNGFTL
jgi:hypothetical protein